MGGSVSCDNWDCAGAGDDPNVPQREDDASQWNSSARPGMFADFVVEGQEGWDCCSNCNDTHIEEVYDQLNGLEESSSDVEMAVRDIEARVALSPAGFAINGKADWRGRYVLGAELGVGQTARVFEAYSADPNVREMLGEAGRIGLPRRRVAIKRFHSRGHGMFHQEVNALLAAGVHPSVVRLLRSYHGGQEDVLVLEHCDGSDAYELYAACNGAPMMESFVAALLVQLLLALQHLVSRNVEHRDVKPENLLLYGNVDGAPKVKLADFGWAMVRGSRAPRPPVPPDGVGSLWYAPPELNPVVKGLPRPGEMEGALGSCDMWSAGVICYLLLLGHSPFCLALSHKNENDREAEVLRLAALGQVATNSRAWSCLSREARSFITSLIQPNPAARWTAKQALGHSWIVMHHRSFTVLPCAPSVSASDSWSHLDGFQRLCWLAVARAMSETELLEVPRAQQCINEALGGPASYVEQLAIFLSFLVTEAWFRKYSVWGDVLILAFDYLDCDGDGFLGHADLAAHVLAEDQAGAACPASWIKRWRHDLGFEAEVIQFADFCRALSSAGGRRDVDWSHSQRSAAGTGGEARRSSLAFSDKAPWSEPPKDKHGLHSVYLSGL